MRVPGSLLIEQPLKGWGDEIPKVSGIPSPEQRSAERPEMFSLVGIMNIHPGEGRVRQKGVSFGVSYIGGAVDRRNSRCPRWSWGGGRHFGGVWGWVTLWGESIRAQGALGFSPIKGS